MTKEEENKALEQQLDVKAIYEMGFDDGVKAYKNLIELEKEEKEEDAEDCISRQEAIRAIQDEYYDHAVGIDIVDIIAHMPPVTPKQKMGRWIDIQYFKADETYYRPKCPFCSIEPKVYSNYCPNCGANMSESEGDK